MAVAVAVAVLAVIEDAAIEDAAASAANDEDTPLQGCCKTSDWHLHWTCWDW